MTTYGNLAGIRVTKPRDGFLDNRFKGGQSPKPNDRERSRDDRLVVCLLLERRTLVFVPVNGRLLGCFIVAQLVDLSAISDLAVNDGMERFGESAETLVDSLPLRCGEVDTVVDFIPQSTCSGK